MFATVLLVMAMARNGMTLASQRIGVMALAMKSTR